MHLMNKIRVGILGCADIAKRLMAPSIKAHPYFELSFFAGREMSKTSLIANQFSCGALPSYQDIINREDIDLVYIPLPNSLHKEWVIKSLLSGKHVLCEKSLGCSYREVEEMVNVARGNKKLLIENFQFRFHSQHQFIKKMLSDGEFGETRCFRSSFGFPPFPDPTNIRYQKPLGGGALLDAGAYTVKATQFILGFDFEVKAANLYISHKRNVDIYGGIYMQNKQGQFAELSFGFDNYYQCNYEIWGSKGKLTATRAFTAGPGVKPMVIIEKQGNREEITLPEDNHFKNMLTYLAECIHSNDQEKENLQNLQQALNLEQVKTLAVRSFIE
jgi:dTDP-3,4-didehydro-2,6-dideoxy-alpha-D-glucose 3-reductase